MIVIFFNLIYEIKKFKNLRFGPNKSFDRKLDVNWGLKIGDKVEFKIGDHVSVTI